MRSPLFFISTLLPFAFLLLPSALAACLPRRSRDDHRARALVREDLGEQRVSRRALDDVRTADSAAQNLRDVLKLRDHPARRHAVAYERLYLAGRQTRNLRRALARAQANPVHVRAHHELLGLQADGDLRGDCVGLDVEEPPVVVRAEPRADP